MDEDLFPTWHATEIPSSPPLDPRYRALSPTSSEPPLFSSDDAPEAADIANYESPRHKRKRAGPWWETEQESGRGKKAKMSRNIDSGVWMASDISDGSSLVDAGPCNAIFTHVPVELPLTVSKETERDRLERELEGMSVAEADMYRYIQEKVDVVNHVNYDFSGFRLKDEDVSPLRLLNQVIKVPLDAGVDVPTERQYRPFNPTLYVNLANNSLLNLAPSVFSLEHLTTLVLRDNHIKSLPPQIGDLRNLTELDLRGNQLECLPAEILHLLRTQLVRLQLLGNPLLEPINNREGHRRTEISQLHQATPQGDSRWRDLYRSLSDDDKALLIWIYRTFEVRNTSHTGSTHHKHCPPAPAPVTGQVERGFEGFSSFGDPIAVQVKLIARTPASYFDEEGMLVQNSPPPSSTRSLFPVIIDTDTYGAYGVPATWFEPSPRNKVHSLFTLCNKAAIQDRPIDEILTMLEEEGVPPKTEKHLKLAESNFISIFTPFRKCHCCGDDYVVPRAEWMEFWWTDSCDCVPVKVQVCSWGCVPTLIATRPTKLINV